MPRNYNFIYTKLVKDQNDVVGHIAYSLYKAEKVEFVETFKKEHKGSDPTETDLKPFHQTTCLNGSIDRYRLTATNILGETLNNTLSEVIETIEKQCKEEHKQMLTEAIEPLKPMGPLKQLGWGALQSIIGAIGFAVLLAVFGFINLFKLSDISVTYKGEDKSQPQTEKTTPSLPMDTIPSTNISKSQ